MAADPAGSAAVAAAPAGRGWVPDRRRRGAVARRAAAGAVAPAGAGPAAAGRGAAAGRPAARGPLGAGGRREAGVRGPGARRGPAGRLGAGAGGRPGPAAWRGRAAPRAVPRAGRGRPGEDGRRAVRHAAGGLREPAGRRAADGPRGPAGPRGASGGSGRCGAAGGGRAPVAEAAAASAGAGGGPVAPLGAARHPVAGAGRLRAEDDSHARGVSPALSPTRAQSSVLGPRCRGRSPRTCGPRVIGNRPEHSKAERSVHCVPAGLRVLDAPVDAPRGEQKQGRTCGDGRDDGDRAVLRRRQFEPRG